MIPTGAYFLSDIGESPLWSWVGTETRPVVFSWQGTRLSTRKITTTEPVPGRGVMSVLASAGRACMSGLVSAVGGPDRKRYARREPFNPGSRPVAWLDGMVEILVLVEFPTGKGRERVRV